MHVLLRHEMDGERRVYVYDARARTASGERDEEEGLHDTCNTIMRHHT